MKGGFTHRVDASPIARPARQFTPAKWSRGTASLSDDAELRRIAARNGEGSA